MKPFRLSLSFLLLLLALSSYGDDVPVTTPIVTETKTRIAFLVGINSYKATTSLKYAVGDSEAIEDLLLRTGKYDKLIKLNDYGKITTTLNPVTLSYTSQRIKMAPTKVNIETTYQEILAENPETLLFYYSGHGFIEGEGGENFIAPKDVDVKFEKRKVGKVEKEVPIPLNGISLKVMGIQATKVKRVVFLIDACRSPLPEADEEEVQIADAGKKELTIARLPESGSDGGKDTKSTKEASIKSKLEEEKDSVRNIFSVKTETLPKRVLEAEGITMLIGAAPEVSSLEDEDFKSGIFTHFLKKAFNGGVQEENQEEYITEENLSRYIEDRFKQYYELRKKETESATEPKLYNLTFDRGKKGELLLTHHRPIEGKERIDKPIYTDSIRKREVKGKLVYNEKGEREDLRFFVHDKKRDLYYPDSLDGVYKMEYSFKKDKAGELEIFTATEFNLENQEVFQYGTKLIPNVGWEYRGLYNASNVETGIIGVETGLRPVFSSNESSVTLSLSNGSNTDKSKIQFEAKIYDFNGNNISEEYFDSNGNPLEFGGVTKTVRAFDKYGQKILEEFYSKETLDEYGDVVDSGKLVAKDGFARYRAKYKSKGNLLLETWEDVEGKDVNNQFGYAKIEYVYDIKDRLTQKKFYDTDKKNKNDKWGVSVYSYSYDSNCIGMYESKIAKITKKENKTAIEDWKLGKYRLCLSEEIHTNKEGKPAGDQNKIYKKIRSFNEKGYLISEENFRPDDYRRHLENGVAKVVYTHDEEGNVISRKNLGEDDEASTKVSDANGVHEYRYTYKEYFNYDGKLILNECMYHRKDKGILPEPYDCALKIEHFGINGKPIEDKGNVFRTSIYYTGAYQEEARRQYYMLTNILASRDKNVNTTYNPFRNQNLSVGNFRKNVRKYDERNNATLEVEYSIHDDGKEALSFREEYIYDEKNRKSLKIRYLEREGKEVPYNKEEYKYDNRNNITVMVEYSISKGKDNFVRKYDYKYDERNNITEKTEYAETVEGKIILESKKNFKYDKKNKEILYESYSIKEGKEIIFERAEYQYDERGNKILDAWYNFEDGREVLVQKIESKFNEKNKCILDAFYKTIDGKEALYFKEEYKYDERGNKTLEPKYGTKEGKEVLVSKGEYKYDERNNITLYAKYEIREGKEVLVWKKEYKFDERNNETQVEDSFRIKEGALVLASKHESKYDERNNKILSVSYKIREGKEVLESKHDYKYDEKNNKTLDAYYSRDYETLNAKTVADYRSESYKNTFTQYEPQIKQIQEKLNQTKDESEKKSLNQNLEDLQKEFEAKKKKYTLTDEKFGKNEKLEFASYKLLFFNPRGPIDKRLMRVDLDQFYRPVKVGFEEE